MKLIICLDERNGMMFNRRRQSRDEQVICDILTHIGGGKLHISTYSTSLFPEVAPVAVSPNPIAACAAEGYCFLEDIDPSAQIDLFSELVIYRWNRHYPADTIFSADLSGFHKVLTHDFPGTSHKKITKEVYQRK